MSARRTRGSCRCLEIQAGPARLSDTGSPRLRTTVVRFGRVESGPAALCGYTQRKPARSGLGGRMPTLQENGPELLVGSPGRFQKLLFLLPDFELARQEAETQ